MKYLAIFLFSAALCSAGAFSTGQAARAIIGQTTFTAQQAGDPTSTDFRLGAVSGLAYSNGMLFVVDSNRVQASPVQNRVLIYNNINGLIPSPTAEITQGVRCPLCFGGSDGSAGADVVLGQPNFTTTDIGLSPNTFRTPTAVASDGTILVVTDTDNNRVLIWKTIPRGNGAPADLVLGQVDFKTVKQPPVIDNKSFRGPQGAWIQNGRLFIADTQNHRVMVWNSIPTSNNQPADYVLGEPNFSSAPSQEKTDVPATTSNMYFPVSVNSDGVRLLVTDLGHNRVMIWNNIPTQTNQPADVVIGQPDLTSELVNNSSVLCASNGTDSTTNKPTYPQRCAATLDFPRYALSDGKRVYVADGGNDRILVFNSIPTQSGQRADVILGAPDEFSDTVTDSLDTFREDSNIGRSSAESVRTPLSLAWDGVNLYVSDPFDRRVLVFSEGDTTMSIPLNGVTNAASRSVFAIGTIDFGGTIKADDTITILIGTTTYTYKVVKADTLTTVVQNVVDLINGKASGTPDPNVFAFPNPGFNEVVLSALKPNTDGNNITYSVTLSATPSITATVSGATLTGGQNAAEVAPGTLVTINGMNLADGIAVAPANATVLPSTLGGVQVYFDGIRAPLLYVSPTQINTQIPFGVADASSLSAYVRTQHADGTISNSPALNIPVVFQNPGIFAFDGPEPRVAIAFHSNQFATAVIDIGGVIKANDVATITIEDRPYAYTVLATDTLLTVRDALVALINANPDEKVTANPAGQFTRILLQAKTAGSAGNGIGVAVSVSTNATIVLTALQATTGGSNGAVGLITPDNPASPGEIISIYATGLGQVQPDDANNAAQAGIVYTGPVFNSPTSPVDDALVGGKTANVLFAGLKQGFIGVYEVKLQLAADLPTNPATQIFIAQNVFTSNIVTIPVVAPQQ
ncbi:MAG: hypothetical protein M3O35_12045 [Acidobacteriota bacterium]|nr:hypothetical protein [Acidobacteriota bacterium]